MQVVRSPNSSPTTQSSSTALSRACSADAAAEQSPKQKASTKRSGPLRSLSRRTSPNSPLRRALSDNTNQANAIPRIVRRPSNEQDQENMDCGVDAPTAGQDKQREAPTRVDFLKPEKLLQPIKKELISPMKSSPLKRSDGVMNLEAASFGSPRNKRRSLHGASLGSDFNIFDYALDGAHSDSTDSSEEKDSQHAGQTSLMAASNSPQRRPFSLRKSTLQQRTGPGRSRLFPDSTRESTLNPALTRARSRMSLDGALASANLRCGIPFPQKQCK